MAGVTPPGTVTVSQLIAVLTRRWRVITAATIAGALAAVALLMATPASYSADAVVRVSALADNPVSSTSNRDVSTATESRIVTSTSVAERAGNTLKWSGSIASLVKHVSVSSPLDSQVLNISFTAGTAAEAAAGANAFADGYLAYREEIAKADVDARAARLEEQIAGLQAQITALDQAFPTLPGPGSAERTVAIEQRTSLQLRADELRNQLTELQTAGVTPGQVAGRALEPSAPDSPRAAVYLLGGVLLGLLGGIAAAIVIDRRKDPVRDEQDLEDTTGLPVLAHVPIEQGRRARGAALAALERIGSPEADAFRALAIKLASPATGQGARSILVVQVGTPSLTTAPLNLAVTLASQGMSVALLASRSSAAASAKLLGGDLPPDRPGSSLLERLMAVTTVKGLHLLSLGDEVKLDVTLRQEPTIVDRLLRKRDRVSGSEDPSRDDIHNGITQEGSALPAVFVLADSPSSIFEQTLTVLGPAVDMIIMDGVNLDLPSSKLTLGRLADAALVLAKQEATSHGALSETLRELSHVVPRMMGTVLLQSRHERRRAASKRSQVRASLTSVLGEPIPHQSQSFARPAAITASALSSEKEPVETPASAKDED